MNFEQTWYLPLEAKLATGEWRFVPEERKPGALGWWRRREDGTTEVLRWFPYDAANRPFGLSS